MDNRIHQGIPYCGRNRRQIPLNIATWNVRTLIDSGENDRPHRRTALVAHELQRYNIDIAALSETRLSEEDTLTEVGEGYTFFWKGYPANERRNHGVGFAVKTKLLNKIPESPVGISERLMSWRIPLAKGRYATLLSAYAPTLDSEDVIKDSFYELLDSAINQTPREDKLILLGDFNARVGREYHIWGGVIGHHGVGNMNSNGLRLLSLCSEHNLVITNTHFQLKNKHKTSWMHPRSKHWHLLDYVIIKKRDQQDAVQTRAMRGAECHTDHNLIRAKLKLTIRPLLSRKPPSKKLNIPALKDPSTRNNYRHGIARKLAESPNIDPNNIDNELDSEWTKLKTIIQENAEETLGFSTRRHQDWFDNNAGGIHDLITAKNKAHDAWLSQPTSVALKENFQQLRSEVQKILRDMENNWWIDRAKETQSYADANDQHGFYNSIKTLYGPTKSSITPVRSLEGNLLKNKQEIIDRWAQHFSLILNQRNPVEPNILNNIPDVPHSEILDTNPTFPETIQAIRAMKNNKSPGPDGLPAELFKEGGYLLHQHLHNLILSIWNMEEVPHEWLVSDIVTIYKRKGDRSLCDNSRGITLLSVASKILARIMLTRLCKHIAENVLPETQCGFRKERSTCDMIFVTRQLQEKCHEQNRDLHIAFIDLTKAFDTVNRDLLWTALSKFGVPPKFLNILRNLHNDMQACVSMGGSKSQLFRVETGVKQGCVLAPVIFNIYLTAVTLLSHQQVNAEDQLKVQFRLDGNLFNLRRLQSVTKTTMAHLMELQYADDCALVAHSPDALQRSLNIVSSIYQAMGLKVNINKTEILSQQIIAGNPPVFHLNGEVIKQVDSFTYLGSILTKKHNIDEEIVARINHASASFGRLRSRVFSNHHLKTETKIAVYRAVCMSTLLYGAESWTIYRRHVKQLEAFHIRCLQRILGLTWQDKVPHSEILHRTNLLSIESTLAEKQLRWIGHVIRMPEHRLPRQILYSQLPEARRNPGGQKKRYKDNIKATLKKCNIQPEQLEMNASDRPLWRSLCKAGVNQLEDTRNQARQQRRERRHNRRDRTPPAIPDLTCQLCGRVCGSRIGLHSHERWHQRQHI